MLIKNVSYSEVPPKYEIRRAGNEAVILFPTDIVKEERSYKMESEDNDDTVTEVNYLAKKVYYLRTNWTNNLDRRVEDNFEKWFSLAKVPEPVEATLSDVIEALNSLTEVVLGGE